MHKKRKKSDPSFITIMLFPSHQLEQNKAKYYAMPVEETPKNFSVS